MITDVGLSSTPSSTTSGSSVLFPAAIASASPKGHERSAVVLRFSPSPAPPPLTIAPRWALICCAPNVSFQKGTNDLRCSYSPPLQLPPHPSWPHIGCQFVFDQPFSPPSPVLRGGRDKPVVRPHCRQTTTTDEDNVGSLGLKEMDERRTEFEERLPLPPASGQRRTSSLTEASSMSRSCSTSFRLVDIIF